MWKRVETSRDFLFGGFANACFGTWFIGVRSLVYSTLKHRLFGIKFIFCSSGGRNILRICLKSRLFGILNHIMKAHQVLVRKILILIEDKSHYLTVLAPQIGATWMQRGTINKTELFMCNMMLFTVTLNYWSLFYVILGIFMTRDDIRKLSLFIDASGDSYSDKEGNLWMITGRRSTLVRRKNFQLIIC